MEKNSTPSYIKYAYPIGIPLISGTIFEILKNQHGIMENSLAVEEWGEVYDSKEWTHAQIQITRELIAEEIQYEVTKNK